MSLPCICQLGTVEELRSKTPDIIKEFDENEFSEIMYLASRDQNCERGYEKTKFLIDCAKQKKCEVTGISLSKNQIEYCKRKAKELNLDNQVKFELIDYREAKGKYDRIFSVGMFEHVGRKFYKKFFKQIDKLSKKSTDDFLKIKKEIKTQRRVEQKKIISIVEKIEGLIENASFSSRRTWPAI